MTKLFIASLLTLSSTCAVLNALQISPQHTILLAGILVFGEKHFAGLWRDGHFDRLETRFRSELWDVKTSENNREFIVGNVYNIDTRDPDKKESQATLWIDKERYKLKGPYRYTYAERLFIKKK